MMENAEARNRVQDWYYLSEMAVSNAHGGGLTLQRILGDDLNSFRNFVHVHKFACESTMASHLPGKPLNLSEMNPMPYFMRRSLPSLRERARSIFGWPTAQHLWARGTATEVLKQVTVEDSKWLVVPQDVPAILVMNEIWRQRPVDYVTWMMDDHVVRWKDGWRYPFLGRFERDFAFHLRHARRVIAISPAMQEFYKARFGVDSEVVFGPSDPAGDPVVDSSTPGAAVRLAYFGAIRDWQHDALQQLVESLEPAGATLDLFGLQDPPASMMLPGVTARPPIPAKDVLRTMREYDGVVIAASFTDEMRHLTELNIATKMAECMASGTVTVIVAPEYAAMSRFAKRHGGALVLNDLSNPAEQAQIANLKDPDWRRRMIAQAYQVVGQECSGAVMRERWSQVWNPPAPAALAGVFNSGAGREAGSAQLGKVQQEY